MSFGHWNADDGPATVKSSARATLTASATRPIDVTPFDLEMRFATARQARPGPDGAGSEPSKVRALGGGGGGHAAGVVWRDLRRGGVPPHFPRPPGRDKRRDMRPGV